MTRSLERFLCNTSLGRNSSGLIYMMAYALERFLYQRLLRRNSSSSDYMTTHALERFVYHRLLGTNSSRSSSFTLLSTSRSVGPLRMAADGGLEDGVRSHASTLSHDRCRSRRQSSPPPANADGGRHTRLLIASRMSVTSSASTSTSTCATSVPSRHPTTTVRSSCATCTHVMLACTSTHATQWSSAMRMASRWRPLAYRATRPPSARLRGGDDGAPEMRFT
ncbi:hypothetical protein NP493_23g01037 [Ridgeia piscesae]|uniref:Uncharacterized protein n=1 Tax=Ridgeia piscesae TaxID=27915 RepID=A0AAD9UKM5_RIDPI|nr:hypothetical protein NP493_23g01037 [Ridgeia piscesae]